MEDKILKACIALLTIGDVIYFINSTGVQSDRNVDRVRGLNPLSGTLNSINIWILKN